MRKIEFDKATFEWSFYGKLHAKFKLNLRHLFANLDVPTVALGWNFDDAIALQRVFRPLWWSHIRGMSAKRGSE